MHIRYHSNQYSNVDSHPASNQNKMALNNKHQANPISSTFCELMMSKIWPTNIHWGNHWFMVEKQTKYHFTLYLLRSYACLANVSFKFPFSYRSYFICALTLSWWTFFCSIIWLLNCSISLKVSNSYFAVFFYFYCITAKHEFFLSSAFFKLSFMLKICLSHIRATSSFLYCFLF